MNDLSQDLKRGFFFFPFSSFSPVSYQPWQQMINCLACAEFSLHISILCLLLWTFVGAQCTEAVIFKAVFLVREDKNIDIYNPSILSDQTRNVYWTVPNYFSAEESFSRLLVNAKIGILCYHSEAVAFVGLLSVSIGMNSKMASGLLLSPYIYVNNYKFIF